MLRKTVWGRIVSSLALGGILAVAPGCPGGGGDGKLRGKVTYDFVPAIYSPATRSGTLAFNQTSVKPVRNALVQVRQGTQILATTTTDEQGNYELPFTSEGSEPLSVVALAQTTNPAIQIEDNTSGDAIWAISASIESDTESKDLHATHGWNGSTFDPAKRTAAPFAVLDSMYTAARAFMAVRQVNFPACKVNWSPNNTPQAGDKKAGLIGTSHFTGQENEIYVLGKAGADTDEFDSHVIVHEWGHYFEHNLSRADSPGGPHGRGDVLDPRIAFGEGYGNAIAAMVLPESVYTDTSWSGGTLAAFGFDAETAPTNPTDDPNPSVFSEFSVLRVLYDLYDSGNSEAHDTVALGLGPLYDVLVGPQKNTDAMTTIGSFITGLKAQSGVNANAVDQLLAHYKMGPITSDFGDGDKNLSDMYTQPASLPYSGSINLGGGYDFNKWEQNQYYVFTGTGGSMTLSASANYDVDIVVYRKGEQVAAAAGNTGQETLTFASQANTKYVLVLTGFKETQGDYPVQITIQP